jgi:hypothetical protein
MTIIFYNDGEIWGDTTITAGDYIFQIDSKVKKYVLKKTRGKEHSIYLASAGSLESITDFRMMFENSQHTPTRTGDTNYAEHFYIEVLNGEVIEQGYYYYNNPVRYSVTIGSTLVIGDASACLVVKCLIDVGLSNSQIIPHLNKHSRIKFEGNECIGVN